MELSLFLAKVLGLYLTIVSLSFLINGKKLRPFIVEVVKDPAALILSGFLALIIGLLIVASHNVWVMDWPVLITIIGWMALLKGVTRLMAPDMFTKQVITWMESTGTYMIMMLLSLILGLVLLYFGYMH